jgi:hypothetical protein
MNTIPLPNNFIGRFYFTRNINGNLIGEFSNSNSISNTTKSAKIINATDDFIGDYNTTWFEDNETVLAKLTISYKPTAANSILQLKWTGISGDTMFIGEGFIFNEILVGDYRDFNISA